MRLPAPIVMILPGLMVAATGVGAGDLAGGALAGSRLGLAVLWAVVVGAVLKFALSEGLTRWQLATGTTVLEGLCRHLGWPARLIFVVYLVVWSLAVGLALISACGVATHALFPMFAEAKIGKMVWGVVHSLMGLALVWFGSFRVFETIMSVCVAVMFAVIIAVGIAVGSDPAAILHGLVVPSIPSYVDPQGHEQGVAWTLALLGGVGGTLTILCYGYWIRENQREGLAHLRSCRIDLAVAYGTTALFGIAMIVIASGADLAKGPSAGLVVQLARHLETKLGSGVALVFKIGAWAAVFSSLLGVWQSVPYLFTDFIAQVRKPISADVDERAGHPIPYRQRRSYRIYLLALAVVPLIGLGQSFSYIQRMYGVLGSALIPLLAIVLLLMGCRSAWIGSSGKTGWLGVLGLVACLVIYSVIGLSS
jgi:Mn2+/Fe2+ NRAMP family transporter